jgi:uncharacterized protein YkwD
MRYWMRAKAARAAAVLFGLSLLLTACDAAALNELLADIMGGAPAAAAEEPAGDAGEAGSEDDDTASGDEDVADEGDEGEDDADEDASEARERCLNRNEHVGNLRSPSRVERKRERRERNRDAAESEEADEAPEEADEAPAEPAEEEPEAPAPARRNEQPAGGGSGGGSANLSNIEQQVFDLLMQERASAGLEPLQLDSSLSRGARAWSQRMGTENFFSHDTSGNFAENIAYGYPSAAAVHDGWMDSDGHRRNRMNAGYTTYGVGVYEQGGTLYYTERLR